VYKKILSITIAVLVALFLLILFVYKKIVARELEKDLKN